MSQQPSHRGRARVRWVALQALVVLGAVFCYFQVRGLTASAPEIAYANARAVMGLEGRLGIDYEDVIQGPVTASAVLTTVANWIYIWGHWPVIIVTLAWLAWLHPHEFRRMRDAMIVSGGLGLVIFVTYPVAPPRLADGELVDTVTEHSYSYRVLQPPNFVNQYAAMPSLHAGWDLLVGISLITASSWAVVRAIGWILPVLMAYAVVATANHYIVDVFAGIGLALAGYAAALLLERRRLARDPPPGARPDEPEEGR